MDMDIWIEISLTLSNQAVLDAENKREAEGGRSVDPIHAWMYI